MLQPGRNDLCPCGSGRKFKRCCGVVNDRSGSDTDARPATSIVAGVAPPAMAVPNRASFGPLSDILGEAASLRRAQSASPAATKRGVGGAEHRLARSLQRSIDAERHWQLGMRLLATGRPAAAISAFRRVIDLNPRDAEAHHLLGRALLQNGRLDEAVDNLRLAIVLRDDMAAAHRDLALALAASGRNSEAIEAGRRAVELGPQLAEGHRLLSELLEAAGDIEHAAECSHRAAAENPGTTAGRLDFVRALKLVGNLQDAEAGLRQALALDPDSDELHRALGEILAESGRFDEAIEECDRALELNPLQVAAHYTAVRIRKCTQADRPRLRRMLSLLRDGSIADEKRLFLHFAIGKLLDDLGEYGEAMRHFEIGNGIRGRNTRFDRAALGEVIDRLVGRFTSAFFADNPGFGLEDETPLLIVGMPRSGTTLVEQIVSSHPAIAAGEELFFWSNRASSRGIAEATALSPTAGRDLATDYVSLLRRFGPTAARVTDKQTFNFQQLGLIHLLLPKARIIHCRRNPIDTCLSMYFTFFKGRMPFVSNKADLAFAYQQYTRIMDHWRTLLPRNRFKEVDYERLVSDHDAVARELIAFSGLDWHDACLAPERNPRRVTTASFWQARQPVFTGSVERWRRYEPWIGEFRQLLPADNTARPGS